MNNYEMIKTTLSGMTTSAGVEIPVRAIVYKGDKTTYITFSELQKYPRLMADDECEYSAPRFDIDIYTKDNFVGILAEIKERMTNAGWTWIEDGPDLYEADTKYFHKTTTFEIENYKI